ncbi:MAG: hypothetical protein GX810_02905 [Clostridiales bacterium]|nr:hypothetical protein [Clostridiales bacterium]
MYTEEGLADINHQFSRRLTAFLIPAALLLAGVVVSLVYRHELVTELLFIALGALAIFAWGVYLSPVHAYRNHVKSVLRGRNRRYTGYFQGFEHEHVDKDGVQFVPFMINVGRVQDELDDRLFYFDANLPLPAWQEGDLITIISQDKAVVSWERATSLPTPA